MNSAADYTESKTNDFESFLVLRSLYSSTVTAILTVSEVVQIADDLDSRMSVVICSFYSIKFSSAVKELAS